MGNPIDHKQLEEAVAALETKIKDCMEKYEGQLKDSGSVATEVRAEIKALAEKHEAKAGELDKLEAHLRELEQKTAGMKGQGKKPETIGQQFVNSDQFRAFVEGKQQKARFEIQNNTIIGESESEPSDVLVPAQRLPGIVPGAFRMLRVLDFLPSGITNSNNIEYTRENLFTNDAAEVSENPAEGKPESDITFTLANAPVRTIAHWLKLSKQVLEDAPALASYVDRRLRYGVQLRAETQIVNGNGTAPNISGLLDSGNFTAFTPQTGENGLDSMNRAKYQVIAADYMPNAYFLNPADWGSLERIKRGEGDAGYVAGDGVGLTYVQNGMIPLVWGLPVVASNSIPEGTFLCGAFDLATQIFLRNGVAVEMFEQDEDNVQKNLVTVRAEQRLAFAIFRPAAIVAGELVESESE